MQYRNFGNTDLNVSEICFGPMRFSAKAPSDDDVSKEGQRALEHAIERGVNFIHSSYEYNTRWAMSRVLKNHPKRHELHHIIKVPVPDFDDGGKFSAAKFRLRVEEALRDLHTDHIDVLQHLQRARPNDDNLRIPDIAATNAAMLECFAQLKAEGKVGYLTTFPYTPGFAAEAMRSDAFSGMVAYYNPIEIEMAEFFPQMEAKGQGFFCIRPFMGGLLTDRRVDRSQLPADDRYQDAGWDDAYKRLEMLQGTMGAEIPSWTDFAIKFSLCHPIVTSLIVGLNSVEQVDGVLDAADGNYPDRSVFESALEIYRGSIDGISG
jgi:aryl-alcohol dehydrogenase-like predicted oxidoreductase